MKDDVVFKALADESRRRLLDALYEAEPKRLADLEQVLDMSRAGVQKHLKILEASGLIIAERRGREKLHFLNAVPIRAIYERWVTKFAERWSAGLLDIKRLAEEETVKEHGAVTLKRLEIRQEIEIEAPRATVFGALTKRMSSWWGAPYLIAPQGAKNLNITLEPRLDGKVFESWGDGDGAMWGRVSHIVQNEALEITGQIGMSGAIYGEVRFELKDAGTGTLLSLTHIAVGTMAESAADGFSGGWTDLLGRLKSFVEEGKISGVHS